MYYAPTFFYRVKLLDRQLLVKKFFFDSPSKKKFLRLKIFENFAWKKFRPTKSGVWGCESAPSFRSQNPIIYLFQPPEYCSHITSLSKRWFLPLLFPLRKWPKNDHFFKQTANVWYYGGFKAYMVGFCEWKLGALLHPQTSDFVGRNFFQAKFSKIFKRKKIFGRWVEQKFFHQKLPIE